MCCARVLSMVAVSLVLLAACGDSGVAGDDTPRTVALEMVDVAFEPDVLKVDAGETVRFVFTNNGTVAHDAFIGDASAQADHEAEMRAGDTHGGHGDAGTDAITLEPGDMGELAHTFEDTGTFEIGCHQEGHYAAGMKVSIEVA